MTKFYQVKTETPNWTGATAIVRSTEVAKYVRAVLKDAFPNQKFSVRKDTTGTINIGVHADGMEQEAFVALRKEVEAKIGYLHGDDFDGMIDMRFSRKHYLCANGEIVYAGTEGSAGSGGMYERVEIAAPEGATPVRLYNDFIFVQRAYNGY